MARRPPSLFRRLLRWSVWSALAAALALQLRVLSGGGLRVPDFVVSSASRRLAARGLAFRAEAIWLDPRGRILVIEPRLGLASAESSPVDVASAHAVALQLRRRDLLRGELAFTRVEITGLGLTLPARQSPSGADERLLEGGELRLSRAPGAAAWSLDQSSARVLGIPTAFTGALPSVSAKPDAAPPPGPAAAVRSALPRAAAIYRRIAELPLDSVRCLRVHLADRQLAVSAELPLVRVPDHPAIPDALVGSALEEVRLVLAFPFDQAAPPELRLDASRLAAPPALALSTGRVAIRLRVPDRSILEAELAASRIHKADTPVPPVPLVGAARYVSGRIEADFATRLANAPWSLRAAGSPAERSGRLSAAGALTPAVLELVRPFLPEKARPILTITDPVSLDLTADLAAGGKPTRVVARATAGRALAHHVPFDRAAATLLYEPGAHLLRADDLLLVQADSAARGTYSMDTSTLAFRFLLGGRLRPMAIEGWFGGWWDRLWADFTFGPVPAAAEVDIQGVWTKPELTTVFVGASSGAMRLRELPLDTLSTRVWTENALVDVQGFHAVQGPWSATGSFARRSKEDSSDLVRLDFDVRSDFPIEALPKIFPKEGPGLIEPFALQRAPDIHLAGHIYSADAPAGLAGRQRYTLDIATSAPMHYQGFPLESFSARVERRDTDLMLHDIRAGFASGIATGRAVLSGPTEESWLAFDLTLPDADLDKAIAAWREYDVSRPKPPEPTAPPAPVTSASAKSAPAKPPEEDKPLGGRVSLTVSATGPVADPLAYSGTGSGRITGANLARIRLLGGFSSLLSSLGIGLTTVELTEAEAEFHIDRNRLEFPRFHLTGPSARVEAKGVYTLTDGTLDFSAKVRPFEKNNGFFSSAADFVLNPLSSALEVELRGPLDDPDWTFSYGPTQFFRRITGSHTKPAAPAPAPQKPSPAKP